MEKLDVNHNASFVRKNVFTLSEKELTCYEHNHKLKRNCFLILVLLIAITFIIHQLTTSIWGPNSIMKGITFDDYESFISYMEQDVPAYSHYSSADSTPRPAVEIVEATYYDEFGNEITEEDARTRYLLDINGNVVCQYIARNESVISVRYTPKDGTVLPITVCSDVDLLQAKHTVRVRNIIFTIIYLLECSTVLFIYLKKRMR